MATTQAMKTTHTFSGPIGSTTSTTRETTLHLSCGFLTATYRALVRACHRLSCHTPSARSCVILKAHPGIMATWRRGRRCIRLS